MSFENDEQLAAGAIEAGAYDEAVRLLRPLAERNSAFALLTLGWIYEAGVTGDPDKDAARSFYEHAISQGSISAYLYLGWLLWRDGQEVEARAAFERGAQLNSEECKSVLARLADNAAEKLADDAIKQGSIEKAVRLLRPLAERNSRYALHALGYIHETGALGRADNKVARSFYERGAAQGDATAYFNLGRVLSRVGEETKARAAFLAGAERGHISSMSRLGRMMVEGVGGPIDVPGGSAWLERAAMHGHVFAQRTLLAIDEANARTLLEKLSIKIKILKLAFARARELARDSHSERAQWLRSAAGLEQPING
jgi:TPR repeat protein